MEKRFWMICFTHMFLEVYLMIQVALIPVYIKEFQLSLLEASLVATVPSIVQLLMNVPSGFITDRFNPKHLLFASMMIEGISALALSQTNSFWTLVLAMSVLKISSPVYHIAGLSQISRSVEQNRMSRSIGFHNALGGLGVAIGLLTLTVSLPTIGWRGAYLAWAFPVLVWGFIILGFLKVERSSEKKVAETGSSLSRMVVLLSGAFVIFLAATGLREVGNTVTTTYMTTYLVQFRGLSETTASLIFGLGPFMGVMGSLSGGLIGEKMDPKKALSLAILGCAISLALLGATSQLFLLAGLYVVYSFFSNSIWVPMNTMVADISPSKDRGLSYSIYFFSEGLIASIAPTAAAAVIGLYDIWYIIPFSIAFLIAGLVVLQFLSYPRGRSTIKDNESQ
jgi:MFS family permease